MNRSAPSITSAGAPCAALLVGGLGEPALDRAHRAVLVVGSVGRQCALGVAADHVPHAGGEQDLRDRDPRRAEADDQHVEVLDLLAGELDRVEQGGEHDDRGAVLVVVEDRDVEAGLQALLDLEAAGRADVLEVDAAERGGDRLDGRDDLVRVLRA